MEENFTKRVNEVVQSIRQQTRFVPDLALVIGTGLSNILADIYVEMVIPYSEIQEFPSSTTQSHKGELVFGTLGNTKILVQNGRFHLYEGWSSDDIVLPIYVFRALGAETYVVTNAAGALNQEFDVADTMLITDHLNFLNCHPLAGTNDPDIGPRFPDMSRAYCPDLQKAAMQSALDEGINLRQGIYAAAHGPQFETSAERRFLTMAGGDAVGMSTVPEVVAANHCGMKVLGFSAITNKAAGDPNQQPDTLEEVIENANIATVNIRHIILNMIENGSFNKA